jgi:hypothetical protein
MSEMGPALPKWVVRDTSVYPPIATVADIAALPKSVEGTFRFRSRVPQMRKVDGGKGPAPLLIVEGLAHPYVCGATGGPQRRPWCDGR